MDGRLKPPPLRAHRKKKPPGLKEHIIGCSSGPGVNHQHDASSSTSCSWDKVGLLTKTVLRVLPLLERGTPLGPPCKKSPTPGDVMISNPVLAAAAAQLVGRRARACSARRGARATTARLMAGRTPPRRASRYAPCDSCFRRGADRVQRAGRRWEARGGAVDRGGERERFVRTCPRAAGRARLSARVKYGRTSVSTGAREDAREVATRRHRLRGARGPGRRREAACTAGAGVRPARWRAECAFLPARWPGPRYLRRRIICSPRRRGAHLSLVPLLSALRGCLLSPTSAHHLRDVLCRLPPRSRSVRRSPSRPSSRRSRPPRRRSSTMASTTTVSSAPTV